MRKALGGVGMVAENRMIIEAGPHTVGRLMFIALSFYLLAINVISGSYRLRIYGGQTVVKLAGRVIDRMSGRYQIPKCMSNSVLIHQKNSSSKF